MKKKIYILDNVHQLFYQRLNEFYDIEDDFSSIDDELINKIVDAYGVILRSRIVFDKNLIDAAPNLKFIARLGAGMESIDVDYAEKKGIKCLNSPEGNRDAVAEHTMGMLLNLLNNLNIADNQVRNGIWNREANRGTELKNKTVGIIGFGNMGAAFAKRLQGFSCRIIAYDKFKTNYALDGVEECSEKELFQNADIVSLHIPLNKENYYFANEKWFNSFKKPIILINTARGLILKTSALLSALNENKVLAAALDVLEYEESSFEKTDNLTKIEDFKKLSQMKNVLFSPHIAGWTVESKQKLADVLIDKILNITK